ncbi:hypothetical protein MYSTI_01358 [Myxococcus stipitatus DSM 14675]|uniref:Cytochrome c domain-containing protein n=1 Tax=Myxococcus stipitatus (strain DSM 14675 / JCM 12634 / Mx s8) TaxID=1278073 RepID=L7U1N6_MYXSD|nr:c-type cytochrome [Myxococcus stipitatus]AGC42706.1 hypothetical protein MYSTI_01358 [Myxococcus stipitatus DSM 14675]
MRRHVLAGVAAALLGLSACEDRSTDGGWSNSSGTVALSRDDAFLYVVDADNGVLSVVETARGEKVGEVKVGVGPERVVVGPDDTVYVSNRGERSVSVIRRGDWNEAARVTVGVEPMGMAVSPKGDTLFVVNSTARTSTEHGTLMAVDTRTLELRWELAVGDEPRGIALVDGGRRALISLFRQGDLVTVDLADAHQPRLQREHTDLYARANEERGAILGDPVVSPTSFRPRGMADVVVSPDGQHAFAPVRWSREDPLARSGPARGESLYGGGGPCNASGVVVPGLVTFKTEDGSPRVDDLNKCRPSFGEVPDFPASTLVSTENTHPLQGPVAAVVDPSGEWLFVVHRETDNVAILPTGRRTGDDLETTRGSAVRQVVRVGSGPSGIALTRDGRKAYVHNAFDHSVTTLVNDGSGARTNVRTEGSPLSVAGDTLSPQQAVGRKLFYSALDSRMTSRDVSVSCESCHLDGREDGHVWGFPDGPRQTPSLAGRDVTRTAPFHWSGEFPTLKDFLDATVTSRMGGGVLDATLVTQLAAFIDVIPAPDNPYVGAAPTLSQARGAEVFKKAGCDKCHAGEHLTNNQQAHVGTFITDGVLQDTKEVREKGLNTPSLLGLARTAPYLHDGSAKSLKGRLTERRQSTAHGSTAELTDAEIDDLVDYLRTL